jgi:hypothetical protein
MARSTAALTAAETAAFNADKPIILAGHYLRDETIAAEAWSGDGIPGVGTEPLNKISRAYDGWANPGNHTRPNTSGPGFFLTFDVGATPASDFDCYVLHMSNPQDCTLIEVQVSDDNFAADIQTIDTPTIPTTPARIVGLDLHHTGSVPLRYSGVRYVRLHFTGSSFTPRVREFWLGRRRQLQRLPNYPYDDYTQRGDVVEVQTQSGVRHQFRRATGPAAVTAELELPTQAQVDEVEAAWSECKYGSEPHYWITEPNTNPVARLMRNPNTEPELSLSQNGPLGWRGPWQMAEQHPHVEREP